MFAAFLTAWLRAAEREMASSTGAVATPPVHAVPHPQPRPIWTDRSGHYRVAALDWSDGCPATYQALVRHGTLWETATGPELWRIMVALAMHLDRAPKT